MILYESREIHTLIPQDLNRFLPRKEIIQNVHINSTLSPVKTHAHSHQELNAVASSPSTSNEFDETRRRRKMSNRESVRRSRMKKKRHMEELTGLVMRLRREKHELVQRLKHVIESHFRVLEENAKLSEEASHLRQMVETPSVFALSIDFDDEPPCKFY